MASDNSKEKSSKEIYQETFKVMKEITGATFRDVPQDFPIKRTTFFYIKAYISGAQDLEKKLLTEDRLNELRKYLGLPQFKTKKIIYSF